jgi:hypothetical protein
MIQRKSTPPTTRQSFGGMPLLGVLHALGFTKICSLALTTQLYEPGVKQDSIFKWVLIANF